MKVNILGAEYTIESKSQSEDNYLQTCNGYCDKSSKRIVVGTDNKELDNFDWYYKKVMRHEIIHAFMYESGLHENFRHEQWGHDETQIDWFAIQFPKMLEVFQQAGCL